MHEPWAEQFESSRPSSELLILTPANDAYPSWRIRDAFGACLLILMLQSLSGLLRERIRVSPDGGVVIAWVVELALIAGVAALMRLRAGGRQRWLVGPGHWLAEAVVGAAMVVPLYGSMIVVGTLVQWVLGPPDSGSRAVVFAGELTSVARVAFAILAVAAGPVLEELLMRGLVLGSLTPAIGWTGSIVLQALIFAAFHRDSLHASIIYFWVGVFLGIFYRWRRSLLGTMVMHAGFNMPASIWLIALLWINAHEPAATMAEARTPPQWWSQEPLVQMPNHSTAEMQYDAVLALGSRGPQLWKLQAVAFQKLIDRFPHDKLAARSALGIQQIYLQHLHDPRRAIVAGERVLHDYSSQREACFYATLATAAAHLELGDLARAEQLAASAEAKSTAIEHAVESIQQLRDEIAHRREH